MDIAVLGMGRVGTVAAACLAEAGHRVLGIDVDGGRVRNLAEGRSGFYEPDLDPLLEAMLSCGSLTLRTAAEAERLKIDIAVVAVGTPSQPGGRADLSQVNAALRWLLEKAGGRALVVMKSTLPPGTGRTLARRYGVPYVASPEFLRQGQAVNDWRHPCRIVIGSEDSRCVDAVKEMYAIPEASVLVTDVTTAEMTKYASNAFLATKISFINEIANLCETVGADIEGVAAGLALDPRIGPSFLKAGIGFGGSCFPKDTRALQSLSALNGYCCELLRAVIDVNNHQRLRPVHLLRRELGSLEGRHIAVLGLAFKPGTDDVRESPALDIIAALLEEGARVRAYDPVVRPGGSQELPARAGYADSAYEALAGAEAAVLCTEWEELLSLDWRELRATMRPPCIVLDGRNALPPDLLRKWGYRYLGVGRCAPPTGRVKGGKPPTERIALAQRGVAERP
jgi:UDPglucose 6-dehydrogenase